MPEHATRDQEGLYDHESDAPRRRPADDWGIDESFPRVRGRRFARRARPRRPRPRGPRAAAAGRWRTGAPTRRSSARAPSRPSRSRVAADADRGPDRRGVDRGRGRRRAGAQEVVTDGRRTIRINGRPGEVSEIAPFTSAARRRRPPLTVEERLAGDPTRIIAWAFLLGLLLILIAVLTS